MSNTTNLAPGTIVPKTGKYKCEFCGEGGITDSMFSYLGAKYGTSLQNNFQNTQKNTARHFEKGKTFPNCPSCGPVAGWTLIE